MADPAQAPGLNEAAQSVENLRDRMQDFGHAAETVIHSVGRLLGALVMHDVLHSLRQIIMTQTEIGRRFDSIWKGVQSGSASVVSTIGRLQQKLDDANARDAGETEDSLKTALNWEQRRLAVIRALEGVGKGWFVTATALSGAYAGTMRAISSINQSLIEANASEQHRLFLAKSTFESSMRTGISFREQTHAAAALVSYGMDTKASFRDNLDLIGKMNAGLGLSVEAGARLAAVVENRLKRGFTEVSDVIARIVDNTTLSANEAAGLAEELANIAATQATPGQYEQTLEVLGEYAGVFKSLGGSTGELERLIDRLATLEGMPAAAMLGLGGRDALTDAERVRSTFRSLSEYVAQSTAGLSTFQREARLRPLAEQLGLSWRSLNLLGMVEERRRKTTEQLTAVQRDQLDVNQRFSDQMRAAGKGLSRLGEELSNVFHRVAAPLLQWVNELSNWAANKVAEVNTWLSANESVMDSATGLLGIFTSALALRFIPVVRTAMQALGGLSFLGGASAAAGTVTAGTVPAAAAGSAFLPVVAGAAVVYLIYKAIKEQLALMQLERDERELEKSVAKMRETRELHEQVAMRGAASANASQLWRGIFGIAGTSDRGLIEQTMSAKHLTYGEAAKEVEAKLRPVIESGLLEARKLSDDPNDPTVKRYESLLSALTDAIRASTEASVKAYKDAQAKLDSKAAQDAATLKLLENTLKPRMGRLLQD